MKAIILAFALIAGVSAVPQRNFAAGFAKDQRNLIETIIENIVKLVINGIQARGLDPLYVESAEGSYTLFGLEDVFSATGSVSELVFEGSSNIVINEITYNLFGGNINLDFTLPKLSGSAASAVGKATVLGRELEVDAAGSLVIENINLYARLRVSIFPGINIQEVTGRLTVGDVQSNLNVVLFGEDVSERVNDLLNNKLPEALDIYNVSIFNLNMFFI